MPLMAHRYFDRPRPKPELEIIDQLVAIRKQRGLNPQHVARRMQCSKGNVSMFETSARRGHSVTLERLLRYADVIGAEIHITPAISDLHLTKADIAAINAMVGTGQLTPQKGNHND
jgi:transcriptional regulator with XRE-family HTH domain